MKFNSANPATLTERLTDEERLQVAWTYDSGRRQVEVLFAGHHFTVKLHNGEVYMGTYTLHPYAKPKRIDMDIEEGPAQHRGKTSFGIYEWIDDNLWRWCPNDPDSEERMSDFPGEQDHGHLCLILRRERH